MSIETCDKHETSDCEVAIVVYNSYRRSYAVAKCPFCELEEKYEALKKEFTDMEKEAE